MKILRLFSGEAYKGTRHYLKTQRVYEILRTVLFFAIALALFAGGYLTTHTRMNLLTIVAILGLLPASKSLVSVIMFCRYGGLADEDAKVIEPHLGNLTNLCDLVFTSNDRNYEVDHLTIKGNTVCGFSKNRDFQEQAFYKHLEERLKADGHKNVSAKIFTDLRKYVDRLDQMQELACDESGTAGIAETLKSISL